MKWNAAAEQLIAHAIMICIFSIQKMWFLQHMLWSGMTVCKISQCFCSLIHMSFWFRYIANKHMNTYTTWNTYSNSKFHLNHKNLQSVKFFAVFKLYINDFADVIKMLTQTNIFYCQSNLYLNDRLNGVTHVQ